MSSVPPLSRRGSAASREGKSNLVSSRPVSVSGRNLFEGTYNGSCRTPRGNMSSANSARKRVDFVSTEAKEAMLVLQKLFLPIIMRKILRNRKRKRWPGENVMRLYTADSIVEVLRRSNSLISSWPEEILRVLAEEVVYFYLEPKEIIVYLKEWYVSFGIVVLLHGKLLEKTIDMESNSSITEHLIERKHNAQTVLCDGVVLCRDASPSCILSSGHSDVAIIPSRWVWDVINSYVLQLSAGSVLDTLRMSIIPKSENIMSETYYPTSLVLRRSWLWPLMSSGDRVRLSRLMEVKVFCLGETLFSEGDRNPYMYIIRRGTVQVLVKKEPLIEFESGTAFGEISILFDEPRCSYAVATSMCEVYCLHRKHLLKRLRKKSPLLNNVIEKALQRRGKWLEEGKSRYTMGLAILLGGVPCLSQTTEKMRMNLAKIAKIHVLPPRQTLFTKGSLCDRLFIIGRGTLGLESGEALDSFRTSTEFVGELCLQPHLWPTNVVTCTSVDGWSLSVHEIMEVLVQMKADVQAVDICRQGIDLYRARNGPESIIERNGSPIPLPPSPPNQNGNKVSPRAKRMTVAFQSDENKPQETPSPTQLNTNLNNNINEKTILDGEAIISDFEWGAYVTGDRSNLSLGETIEPLKRSERRHLEQSIENELSRRAGELLSVHERQSASEVDSDYPGEIDDIQQMLVEQAFLVPTERQAIFLRQINRSKVTLIMDDALIEPMEECLSSETTVINDLTLPQYVVPPPVVYTLDSINSENDANLFPVPEENILKSPRGGMDFAAATTPRPSRSPESGFLPNWQINSNRSHEESVSFISRSRPQSGVSTRSRQLQPSSGFTFRRTPPRASSAGGNHRLSRSVSFCSRTSLLANLGASHTSESQSNGALGNVNSWAKSTSKDISQQAKINAAMFQSALDRFVKLDDQNYFHEMVRVCLPPQMEEHWTEEEVNPSKNDKDGLVLLLMHVRRCEGLEISETIKTPLVKVSTNTRVLIRTPIMQDRTRPVWPIEIASFISFIRRDSELKFTVCDSEDEKLIAYTAILPTSEIREDGGVGLRALRMFPEELGGLNPLNNTKARIEVCMLAVTASKYSSLKKHLSDDEEDEKSSDDISTVYLQVLGVQGLKHRIEAVIAVSVENDGKTREILRTPKLTPKTRLPAWPGQSGFCVIHCDGVVSFDLYHRDMFLASYDTPVDTLAFGGTGIHSLPLIRAQGNPGEVYGELLVSVLGLKNPSSEDDLSERPTKVLVVHVESFKMIPNPEEEFTPDPFVIVRGPKGEVIMRTSMNFGTYDANWSEEGASCFIMCPALVGCTAIYRFEVYDNNESNKIGTAEMTVTMNGTKRNRMQLSVEGKGTLTILAHSFPIQEPPRPTPPPPSLRRENESLPSSYSYSKDDALLLLMHVNGCDNLQGTGFDDFQIDPLVTARIGRRRMVVAPLVSGSTAPRWPYPKATLVLPVVPELLNYITLEVWDTNIELCDVLGVARIGIEELCRTGTQQFPLQPHKDQEFGRWQNLGTITVKTRLARMNSGVIPHGSSDIFNVPGIGGSTLFETRLFHSSGNAPDLPVTKVRVHISSCCALTAAGGAPVKSVKVTMSCLQHILLEVKKNCAKACCPAWAVEEASATLDLRAIYGRSLRLTVACSSKSSDGAYAEVGAALVPFATLVASTPEVVFVRSFPLMKNSEAERRESTSMDGAERSRTSSVSFDVPSVTIALLAVDAAHAIGVEGN